MSFTGFREPVLGQASPVRAAAGRQAQGARMVDLALLALAALLLRGLTLSLSMFDTASSADEGAFILAAREVLLGHLPYVTFWDHKPLGSTLLIAAAMKLFGQSVETVRLMALAAVVVTAWLLHAIAWRLLADRLVAVAAGLLYVAFTTRLTGLSLMTEILLAPFTAAGVYLLLTALDRPGTTRLVLRFAAAGLCFGIGTWIKYVPAIPAALVGGLVLATTLARPDRSATRLLAPGLTFSVLLLLPSALSILAYWQAGLLAEFLHANFGFATQYVGQQESPRGLIIAGLKWASLAIEQIWPLLLLALAALLPASLRALRAGGRGWGWAVLGAWLLGEVVALVLQRKFYQHHFLLLLPPMAILAAATLRLGAARLALPARADAAFLAALGFTLLVPLVPHAREVSSAVLRPDEPREIAARIRAELPPGETIFVANSEPILYFLAGAPLPTRYAFPTFLTGTRALGGLDTEAELRRVLATQPKYIVVNEGWPTNLAVWNQQAMQQVAAAVAEGYAAVDRWALPNGRGVVVLYGRQD